jgi:hypothetical protein
VNFSTKTDDDKLFYYDRHKGQIQTNRFTTKTQDAYNEVMKFRSLMHVKDPQDVGLTRRLC